LVANKCRTQRRGVRCTEWCPAMNGLWMPAPCGTHPRNSLKVNAGSLCNRCWHQDWQRSLGGRVLRWKYQAAYCDSLDCREEGGTGACLGIWFDLLGFDFLQE
jgi:hypothetical protein